MTSDNRAIINDFYMYSVYVHVIVRFFCVQNCTITHALHKTAWTLPFMKVHYMRNLSKFL